MSEQPAPPPPPAAPVGASRYGWFVGVVVVLILAYITVNTLSTDRNEGPRPGTRLAPFAAPLLLSDLDGDVNVARRADSGNAGRVPACSVRGPKVLNSCDLSRGAPVVLGFFFTRGAACAGSFDVMQRLSGTTPGVRFAGIVVRGDRDDARKVARQHGWRFPVGWDRDGQLANIYGVAGCPDVVLAYPGGRVRETLLGRDRAERALPRRVAALVAASRRRGWAP